MNFRSDNVTGAHPRILEALARGAEGRVSSYGADPVTARVVERLGEVFERPVSAFPVATGSAANSLALACAVPPWGAIYAHEEAHIETDECGAPEFFSGGAKIVKVPGDHGRIDPTTLGTMLERAPVGDVHSVQPRALSLTNGTEAGTTYSPDQIAELAAIAHRHGLFVHMDGARFANAVAALGCSPAEATWKVGVDALSFGATKNGCLAAEAVVFFQPDAQRDTEFAFRRKRAGHLFSKMRFLSVQLEAYLQDGLWLEMAGHANAQARRLADGLTALPGVRLAHPVEINELFIHLPPPIKSALEAAGVGMAAWDEATVRMVTAFNTEPAEVEHVLAIATKAAAEAAE
jgi:threonine aldolase